MAEKAKKNNKNLIIGICVAVLAIVVVVVAVIFATKGTNVNLNDSYFVSDNAKYVITLDSDMLESNEEDEYPPIKTHLVYEYSGDNITGMTTYMEYADANTAKSALDFYKSLYGDTGLAEVNIASLSTNGKYLVIVSTENEYAGKTASDVKQEVDFVEMIKNSNLDESTEETK